MNWSELVFKEEWMSRLDRMTVKRFGGGGLAEEAATYVIEQLSANDWEKCRQFKGQSQPTTFLFVLASNFIEEFSRKRFGRPRPPSWLKRQGQLWVDLWQKLCMERQSNTAVVESYRSRKDDAVEEITVVVKTIKARIPTCGETNMEVTESKHDEEDSREAEIEDVACAQFDHVGFDFEVGVQGEMVLMLRALFVDGEPKESQFQQPEQLIAAEVAGELAEKITALRDKIALSDEEKIMLRMIYQDGFSRTTVSKALGLPSHQTGRTVGAALKRIEIAFEEVGIDLESALRAV